MRPGTYGGWSIWYPIWWKLTDTSRLMNLNGADWDTKKTTGKITITNSADDCHSYALCHCEPSPTTRILSFSIIYSWKSTIQHIHGLSDRLRAPRNYVGRISSRMRHRSLATIQSHKKQNPKQTLPNRPWQHSQMVSQSVKCLYCMYNMK